MPKLVRVPNKDMQQLAETEEDSPKSPTSPEVSEDEEQSACQTKKTTTTSPAPGTCTEMEVPALEQKKRTRRKGLVLTEDQEVSLGEWLRNHPEIYTKSMKAYKEIDKKKRLWEEKADELGLESAALLRTWYESVRTKIGKIKTGASGSAATQMSERDEFLERNFGFLRGHISRVRGRTAMSVSIMTSIVHTT